MDIGPQAGAVHNKLAVVGRRPVQLAQAGFEHGDPVRGDGWLPAAAAFRLRTEIVDRLCEVLRDGQLRVALAAGELPDAGGLAVDGDVPARREMEGDVLEFDV